MARKNKKKRRLDAFVIPIPIVGTIVALAGLGLLYVWLGCRCELVGRELKALEKKQRELTKKYVVEQSRWAKLKSPRTLRQTLERHGIVMGWPRRDQVVRLFDTEVHVQHALELASNTGPSRGTEGALMND